MRYLPIHVDTQNTTIRVFGGEEAAEAKLRTLLKTEAKIEVYADVVSDEILRWAKAEKLSWIKTSFDSKFLEKSVLIYAATEDDDLNAEIASQNVSRVHLALWRF